MISFKVWKQTAVLGHLPDTAVLLSENSFLYFQGNMGYGCITVFNCSF
ncbi:hypothetical protein NEICINOT_05090 [Neisseria cinerea ATCC 14685]|uniref:Uncharacterized protein n=1 Tax=Neisseria cinerea ATCC 14685 TaxID=546262 RepID=D0W5W9_NEICI|nr:hypothetical protein NEICINOT_05090 [Neisseria cinerea ATCC 14685]